MKHTRRGFCSSPCVFSIHLFLPYELNPHAMAFALTLLDACKVKKGYTTEVHLNS
jgi:hypothetical protein